MLEYSQIPLEIKADAQKEGIITGYASIFGNTDNSFDVVVKGAFLQSLAKRNPMMIWQHDHNKPIGVWRDVTEDMKGLAVEGEINLKTTMGRDIYELCKQGAVGGLSIGYIALDYEYEGDKRILKKLDLREISLVTFPCNEKAKITGVKNQDVTSVKTIRDFEVFLRVAGFSKNEAKNIASHGYKPERWDAGQKSKNECDAQIWIDGLNQLTTGIKNATGAIRA